MKTTAKLSFMMFVEWFIWGLVCPSLAVAE
jgi:hypothetical protein